MKSMLFVVGPALGHVSRLYTVAESLQSLAGVEIVFATPAHAQYARNVIGDRFEIVSIPVSREALPNPAFEFGSGLESLFKSRRFDAVVRDLCPLTWISTTRFPEIPHVNVTNVFLTRLAGERTAQTDRFANVGVEVNRWRREKGMAELESAHSLYEADLVLLADPPSLVLQYGPLPENYRCCGPCFWSPDGKLPDELAGQEDILLLSMGSTGRGMFSREVVKRIVNWSGSRLSVYAGGSAEDIAKAGIVDKSYSWLPLQRVLNNASATITQGGAGSTYMALSSGVPVIVVPTHRNHVILGRLVEEAGLGLCMPDDASLDKLATAHYGSIASTVRMLSMKSRQLDGAGELARHIAGIL